MPVSHIFEIENNKLVIWKSEQDESFILPPLSVAESEELNQLPPSRRLQGLVFRKMLQQLLPNKNTECLKDNFGKPFLTDLPLEISFSHSGSYLAAIASESSVGIDIQQFSSKMERVAHKFVAESEWKFIENEHFTNYLHLLWSAKESLYKADGKKGLEFKTQLIVEPFEWQQEGGTCFGKVIREESTRFYKINYRILDNMILVWAVLESK